MPNNDISVWEHVKIMQIATEGKNFKNLVELVRFFWGPNSFLASGP